jgi:hypothetical protein
MSRDELRSSEQCEKALIDVHLRRKKRDRQRRCFIDINITQSGTQLGTTNVRLVTKEGKIVGHASKDSRECY